MYSPAMSDRKLEGLIPRYPFTLANNDILRFNQTNLDAIRDVHVKCGFDKVSSVYRAVQGCLEHHMRSDTISPHSILMNTLYTRHQEFNHLKRSIEAPNVIQLSHSILLCMKENHVMYRSPVTHTMLQSPDRLLTNPAITRMFITSPTNAHPHPNRQMHGSRSTSTGETSKKRSTLRSKKNGRYARTKLAAILTKFRRRRFKAYFRA